MQVDHERLLRNITELVRIPSHDEVDTIADHVLKRLAADGVEGAWKDEDGNVIIEMGEGDGLLLNAHLDTVGVSGFEGDPYGAEIEGDRLVGRGVCDDKSGAALMLELARTLKDAPLRRRLIFAFSVWEEGLAPAPNGAFGIALRHEATQGIVLEQSVLSEEDMGVNIGCRGVLRFDVVVKGKPCHSSRPDLGENAVYRAARFLRLWQEEFTPDRMPAREFVVLDKAYPLGSIATVTEIEARQGRNIIPGRCVLGVDCRLYPYQEPEPIVERAEALAEEVAPGEIAVENVTHVSGHVCDEAELIRVCAEAAEANGFRPVLSIHNARTDGAIFHNEGDIPCVVFGPGNCGQAHTTHESLVLPLFYRGARTVCDAVEALAAGGVEVMSAE